MQLNRVIDHDFAMWAFGETWIKYLMWDVNELHLINAWNELHPGKIRLNPFSDLPEAMQQMKRLWAKAGKPKYHETSHENKVKQQEDKMDKKMHKVTLKMKEAEKDIKKGKPKLAAKVLKNAEKKNEKLVKIDKNVRDPIIDKFKKMKKDMK